MEAYTICYSVQYVYVPAAFTFCIGLLYVPAQMWLNARATAIPHGWMTSAIHIPIRTGILSVRTCRMPPFNRVIGTHTYLGHPNQRFFQSTQTRNQELWPYERLNNVTRNSIHCGAFVFDNWMDEHFLCAWMYIEQSAKTYNLNAHYSCAQSNKMCV